VFNTSLIRSIFSKLQRALFSDIYGSVWYLHIVFFLHLVLSIFFKQFIVIMQLICITVRFFFKLFIQSYIIAGEKSAVQLCPKFEPQCMHLQSALFFAHFSQRETYKFKDSTGFICKAESPCKLKLKWSKPFKVKLTT